MSIFSFVISVFVVISKKSLWNQCSEAFALCFMLNVLQFLSLNFKPPIHCESTFLYCALYKSNFILLYANILFFQNFMLKRLSFLHWIILTSLLKSFHHICEFSKYLMIYEQRFVYMFLPILDFFPPIIFLPYFFLS